VTLKAAEVKLAEYLQDQKFKSLLESQGLELKPLCIETLWANITSFCNQSCRHCHVGGSPQRKEQMDRATIDRCLEILSEHDSITSLDITGGAPELNPDFEYFVTEGRKLGKNIKVRHNLSVIIDGNPVTRENKNHLPDFFSENGVQVLASLPHYNEAETDDVRGAGVFQKSIKALTLLNGVGYGKAGGDLVLNLVCNVDGPVSASEHDRLEAEFHTELRSRYGILFNRLLCVTNMPINRYHDLLTEKGSCSDYMGQIIAAFDPGAVSNLVCRSLLSIGYDGRIYDCDFNQALGLQTALPGTGKMSLLNFDLESLLNREIIFGAHCFGCTAGGGSN
jgi:radical SAM/Cys-rich protein